MTEQSRFFRWIYRALALSGLLIVSMIAYVFVREALFPELWPASHTIEISGASGNKGASTIRMHVGSVTRIKGSAVKMIEMTTVSRGTGSLRSGGRNYGDDIRNLIFIVEGQPEAKWLFEKNGQRLRSIQQVCACDDRAQSGDAPTTAIFLEVIRTDSDGDGELDWGDRPVPALLRPDGSGYAELGPSVENILDTSLSEDGERFGLLINDGGKLLYREYAITDFSLHSEQVLTELDR
ncbi:MAG: hypothetical protein HOP03_09005 [Lysobacter sp.]|nr:hypothetical protein [Lysobacter sp.]